MRETVRVETRDGAWKGYPCSFRVVDGAVELRVPKLAGTWLITKRGMFANVGGNDWAIYTLHPEDCARLCAAAHGALSGEGE